MASILARFASLLLALWAFYWRAQLEVYLVWIVNVIAGLFAGGLVGAWGFADPPWIYVFAIAAGLGVFAVALLVAPFVLPRLRPKPHVPPELYELFRGYAQPAFDAAATLLNQARHGLQESSESAKHDLAGSVQRAYDDGARAYSRAANALVHEDGSDPDTALGDFYRQYQGMTTWIGKGFDHSVLYPEHPVYRQWWRADDRFLEKLHDVAASPERSALYESVRSVGWGESVRARLPELDGSTHTPSRDRPSAVLQLQEYAAHEASASVVLYPESQRPLADMIVALFRDAGWNAGSPSASFEKWHGYFKGIEVRGCDPDRIDAIANALTAAGVPMVRTFLEENELSPDHPKYQRRRQSIQVRVGYTLMDKP